MKNQKIQICDATVQPGESAHLALTLPEQYTCAPLYMPIKVINGISAGPCLVIFSILKGTELNGLEIVNALHSIIDANKLSGTLIAIPVVNVYGLTHYPSELPLDATLADCFPGSAHGSFGERMAHVFTQEILKKADYCIELQTGELNHNILPQVYCDIKDHKARDLAKIFRSPVVTNVASDDNTLRQTTDELGIPFLVYQAGEAMRFDQNAIDLGVKGVKNVMRALDMLETEPVQEINPVFSRNEEWIAAHKGGIFTPKVTLGQTISKKEVIGAISDPFGADPVESVIARKEGMVVGINTSPLIHEGLPLIKVASFLDIEKAESVIEAWDQKQPDSYIG